MAIKARIHPLKTIGSELLDAGVSAFRALWPLADAPNTTPELAAKLREAEQRLREWRSSSARAGADAALKFIMTWCEKIDLEKMDTLRRGSPWSSDPILIKRREKMAAFFAGYANTKHLSEGDTYSDAEDYEPEERNTRQNPTSRPSKVTAVKPAKQKPRLLHNLVPRLLPTLPALPRLPRLRTKSLLHRLLPT